MQLALWPCLEQRDGDTVLRNIETTDTYCIFKAVWGKSHTPGLDLDWFREAVAYVGIPENMFDWQHLRKQACEFERVVRKFHATKTRKTHGIVGLERVWAKLYPFDDEYFTACSSLPPGTDLK